MDLPIELWHLIVYNLKFDVDLYKNGPLVNKLLYKIVKNTYDKIPDKIYIKLYWFYYFPDKKYKWIRSERFKSVKDPYHFQFNLTDGSFEIHKNELLLRTSKSFSMCFHAACHCTLHYNLHFLIEDCLDENLNRLHQRRNSLRSVHKCTLNVFHNKCIYALSEANPAGSGGDLNQKCYMVQFNDLNTAPPPADSLRSAHIHAL